MAPKDDTANTTPKSKQSTGDREPWTETQADSTAAAKSTSIQAPRKNNRRALLIAVAVVLVLLVAGFLGYKLWYQNPDKVMADALGNALAVKQAKTNGTFTVDTSEMGFEVKFNSNTASDAMSGRAEITLQPKAADARALGTINLTGEGVLSSTGDLYVKATNVRPVAERLIDALFAQQAKQYQQYGLSVPAAELEAAKKSARQQILPAVAKIDNRWIKVSADEMKKDGDNKQKCFSDLIKKIQSDGAARAEVIDTYKANKFVTVKKELGEKDGSLGYELDFNREKAKSFGKDLETTTVGKDLKKCDENAFSNNDSSSNRDSDTKGKVEVWITSWGHQISAIKASGSSDGTTLNLDLKTNIGKSDEIKLPTDATNFRELESEFRQLSNVAR